MLISPSVLNSDLGRLSEEIAKVEGVADLIHLDVMDNHFVPNLTFGLPVVQRVIEQTSLPADVHLMITDPDRWAPAYGDAGAYSVTFHIEAAKDPVLLAKNIKSTGARAAAALKPGTPLESLDGVLEHLDMVLIMTVEPGFGGQAFMSDMMPKVSRAHELGGAKLWIEVDGGVSHNTILECKQAGANVFVAGSCVYSSEDPAQVVRDLKALVGE
ncbi:MAG: ribulose-phosphate 3-epimerase [Candidatus Nanopelagicales bacterium]|jgi:ribulose-phosphate 3-epimerase|nr:ribulose-phosphate 3-epimerase [Actinomycetes bacterium]MCH9830343.1 ribulose-phosphate 3-epimerase [Actinomycetes bacterium]MCH9841526.1 ribulose-phosphate 3-epimerase [Actinomycetes bacterium]